MRGPRDVFKPRVLAIEVVYHPRMSAETLLKTIQAGNDSFHRRGSPIYIYIYTHIHIYIYIHIYMPTVFRKRTLPATPSPPKKTTSTTIFGTQTVKPKPYTPCQCAFLRTPKANDKWALTPTGMGRMRPSFFQRCITKGVSPKPQNPKPSFGVFLVNLDSIDLPGSGFDFRV